MPTPDATPARVPFSRFARVYYQSDVCQWCGQPRSRHEPSGNYEGFLDCPEGTTIATPDEFDPAPVPTHDLGGEG